MRCNFKSKEGKCELTRVEHPCDGKKCVIYAMQQQKPKPKIEEINEIQYNKAGYMRNPTRAYEKLIQKILRKDQV